MLSNARDALRMPSSDARARSPYHPRSPRLLLVADDRFVFISSSSQVPLLLG
ncbi:MAG: hypothetical protein F6J93_29475 [Oscillatoria sp. SIO1A7]|nr:hypothetical protein [Oscillatoria sp. SIO1A7]